MYDKLDPYQYLKSISDKNWIDIIIDGGRKIDWALSLKTKTSDERYYVQKYSDFIRELLFFLQNGIKPAFMNENDFQLTKELIENLVNKGQLKPGMLEHYNKKPL